MTHSETFLCGFAALLVFAAGNVWGRYVMIRSLLIDADCDNKTPHKLGNGFYYMVPESEYC